MPRVENSGQCNDPTCLELPSWELSDVDGSSVMEMGGEAIFLGAVCISPASPLGAR